ncbi:hypothetical protein N7510_003152 [Penicillium lagena]|uniref:uncharacterized protein n=1 Tax=Penicillium lagena TaxID=94218 RepID=UPI002540D121|nr:uncharacterized protein N7510_003152 [Penicillium lagena]KAJ5619168.1 hypothetical protein N7510_003152 [Penicillium lagena]
MASVQILDGGLGTSLQDKYGVKFDSSTPLWASHLLVADPATLQACQQDFVAAGTDVLLTATYQVSAEGFERTKTADFPSGVPKSAIGPFLRTALDVAEQAKASANTKIALSLGPYGACMIPGQEPYFAGISIDCASLREAEKNLIQRVQYVAFETLPRLDEVRAVRRAIRAAAIEVPFWISCVFPEKDDVLPDGSSIEQVVSAAVDLREGAGAPWGIGINCTKIHKLPNLVSKFGDSVAARVAAGHLATAPCLVLYPDGTNGEIYNTSTQTWERPTNARDDAKKRCPWELQLAQVVQDATASGNFHSFLVGGCCKASHADIEKLHDRLKNQ